MRRRSGRVGIVIGALALESLALAHLWLSSGPVLLSTPSDDIPLIAQVVTRRDFPYLSVQAYLQIRDGPKGKLREQRFLLARDEFQDLVNEVHSLEWRGHKVALDVDSARYAGPKEYEVRSP